MFLNNEQVRNYKEAVIQYFKLKFWNSSSKIEKYRQNISGLSVILLRFESGIFRIQDMKELYRCINFFGFIKINVHLLVITFYGDRLPQQ
jgi:hypothetical protein